MQVRGRSVGATALVVWACACTAPDVGIQQITYSQGSSAAFYPCYSGAQQCVGSEIRECVSGHWINTGNCADSNTACTNGQDPDTGVTTAVCALPALPMRVLPTVSFMASTTGPTGAVLHRAGRDTLPAVVQNGIYRMWWQGDVGTVSHIFYAEAASLAGPWHAHGSTVINSFNDVLQPTGRDGDFDGSNVGGPHILAWHNAWYMYYEGTASTGQMSVGVAMSPDGITWTRQNNGQAIVRSAQPGNAGGAHGASVIDANGQLMMLYTDTYGLASTNGVGLYVLRADDPLFQNNLMELGINGFAPLTSNSHTAAALLHVPNTDWVYVDAMDAYAIAADAVANRTDVYFFDADLRPAGTPLALATTWEDAPAIVARPDHHALPGSDPNCSSIPFDLMHAVPTGGNADNANWDLGHDGGILQTDLTCAKVPVERVYLNAQISTETAGPSVVINGGVKIAFQQVATANAATQNSYTVSDALYTRIPQLAQVVANNVGYVATGLPAAFYDTQANYLLPAGCQAMLTANGTTPASVTAAQYNTLRRGPTLYCIP